jgi:hypothetical protein
MTPCRPHRQIPAPTAQWRTAEPNPAKPRAHFTRIIFSPSLVETADPPSTSARPDAATRNRARATARVRPNSSEAGIADNRDSYSIGSEFPSAMAAQARSRFAQSAICNSLPPTWHSGAGWDVEITGQDEGTALLTGCCCNVRWHQLNLLVSLLTSRAAKAFTTIAPLRQPVGPGVRQPMRSDLQRRVPAAFLQNQTFI